MEPASTSLQTVQQGSSYCVVWLRNPDAPKECSSFDDVRGTSKAPQHARTLDSGSVASVDTKIFVVIDKTSF